MKINRTVFISSNYNVIYYVKLEDGSLIKKFNVEIKKYNNNG